jgi:signal transduction histidine kinase
MDNYEDFISTVSHELRTPLTSIRGFSQTMLNSWDKLDDESKKKFLKIIEEQSNRLIALVENMLSVTQSARLILKDVHVKPVVEAVVSILKPQYPTRTFEVEISAQTPAILADKDKFQQVMTNLIENAAKYSDENSTVTIKAVQDKDLAVIKVVNTGIGIDEKDYEKVFEKFSRVDNPLTRKTEGSGLGLYITKSLVEKMGGGIAVQSDAKMRRCAQVNPTDAKLPLLTGEGWGEVATTTFTVTLPISNPEARLKCSQ